MKHITYIVALTLLSSSLTFAQQNIEVVAKKTYTTQLTDNPPVIDGVLDDASWDAIDWGGEFVEKMPDEGTPPTEPTQFKILYDAKYLYVAIRAFDSNPKLIEDRLSRRDGFAGDRVNVMLDSYHDKRTAFVFTVTAAGVKGDEIATQNGRNWDDSWNPIWYTKAKIDDKGWTAEMKIPFSQLRFGKAEEQVWGLNVIRNLFRNNERSLWQRVPNTSAGFISDIGELRGLKNLVPQKQLEIQPFTVLQYDSYPEEAGNPFRDGSDFKVNGGLDAKIGITNDLTLDLTVNPDFGQVEADPGAIALDGFQIFFQEQRPFFVENKNIFDFRFANGRDNLFYSRRIGKNPTKGSWSLGLANNEHADVPVNTTILGAAKFSGKTKNGWSIGILESVTANEYAKIKGGTNERKEIVEPLTNYLIGRVQKDFNKRNSYIGGIFTATNRNIKDNFDFLHSDAYTAGLDFRHMWKNQNYFLEGSFVSSHVIGKPEAIEATQRSITHLFQREDAGHVDVDPTRTSLTGTGGKFRIGRQAGGNWSYEGGFIWRSPELELNDVGFLRQADEIIQNAEIGYEILKPTKTFRAFSVGVEQVSTYDFEGNFNRMQYEFGIDANWQNNWWTEFGGAHKPRIFINTFLRGGPRWRYNQENFFFLFTGTDQSKKFHATVGYVDSRSKQDNFSFNRYVLRLSYQPINQMSLFLSTEYEVNPNKTQYVTQQIFNGDTRYILGNIDQKTWNATLRVNYSINPNLSLQYYGQPFISRGRYNNFNFVNNPIAKDLNDRVTWYSANQISNNGSSYFVDEDLDNVTDYSFGNPDFSFVQFRSNLVARWEYIPGSEVFLVWSQGVSGLADPENSLRDALQTQIGDQKKDNTFLIKFTYRFVK